MVPFPLDIWTWEHFVIKHRSKVSNLQALSLGFQTSESSAAKQPDLEHPSPAVGEETGEAQDVWPRGSAAAVWMSLTVSGFLLSSCRPSNWRKTNRENPLPNLLSASGQWYRLQLNTFVSPRVSHPSRDCYRPLPPGEALPSHRTLSIKYAKPSLYGVTATCQRRTAPASTAHPVQSTPSARGPSCGVLIARWFMGCVKRCFCVRFPLTFSFSHALTWSLFMLKCKPSFPWHIYKQKMYQLLLALGVTNVQACRIPQTNTLRKLEEVFLSSLLW